MYSNPDIDENEIFKKDCLNMRVQQKNTAEPSLK